MFGTPIVTHVTRVTRQLRFDSTDERQRTNVYLRLCCPSHPGLVSYSRGVRLLKFLRQSFSTV